MILDEIGDYLETLDLATVGMDLFKGQIPPEPANCLALFELPGGNSIRTGRGVLAEECSLRVVARNQDYSAGRSLIDSVYKALDMQAELTLDGCRYLYIEAKTPPYFAGQGVNGTSEFFCTFRVVKEPN